MTADIRTAYLHGAVVRRVSSGKDYVVEGSRGVYWASPLKGYKLGAPVSKKFLIDNFELVEESIHDPSR